MKRGHLKRHEIRGRLTEEMAPQFSGNCSIVVGNNGCLLGLIVVDILQRADDRLGSEPMANGIAAGALFPFHRVRSGAFSRVAAVGFDLSEGRHCGLAAVIGFVL
jgi:hypothetical protein